MKTSLPTRILREHPDLDQLRRQAKELLQAFLAGEHAAVAITRHGSGPNHVLERAAKQAARLGLMQGLGLTLRGATSMWAF